MGKLSNGSTDWHQIWHTCLRIRLGMNIRQTNCPSRHKGAHGGFRGSTIQKSEEALKRLDRWHQLWFMSADSSGNGHRLNTSHPTIPQGAFGGVRGSQIQMSGEAVKRLDRLEPNLVNVCGFVWEWT